VVRTGADGVGFSFLQQAEDEQHSTEARGARIELTHLAQFLKGLPMSEPDAFERAS